MVAVYPALEEAGAAGIIGVMQNYPKMGPLSYYAPYDGELRAIPGFYIRDDEGDKLKRALAAGPVKARLTLDAAVTKDGGQAPLIYGVLPGRSESSLMLHSHYDSPWASGTEDSSGTGMLLSLARYYARVPAEQRERTLVFVLTGSHMVGAVSNQAFYEKHRNDLLKGTLFDIAIEHVADDYPFDTKSPTVRGVFVSENPTVTSIYSRSVVAGGLGRTLVLPTGSPLGVPTDANPFRKAGMKIVSLISGPVYLIDDADSLDRVFKPDLAPIAAAYVDFIGRMDQRPDLLFQFRVNGLAIGLLLLLFTPLGLGWFATRREACGAENEGQQAG